MTRSSRIVRTLTVLAAALAVLCTACGSGSPPPRLVTSRYETATGHRIVRDCGFSVPLPGQARRSLWLFCDTAVTGRDGRELGYPILGAGTAAEGPYTRGPRAGRADRAGDAGRGRARGGRRPEPRGGRGQLPARAAPQPFLPVPASLTLPASTAALLAGPHTYPARWVTGAAREPGSSGHVLISYADYCVSGGGHVHPGGVRPARLRSGGQRARPAGPGVHGAARAAAAAAAGARLAGLPRRLPVPVRLVRAGLRPRRGLPGQDEPPPPRGGTTGSPTSTGPARAGRPTWRTRRR